MLGLHLTKLYCPHEQRRRANELRIPVFQTVIGSTQSFSIPRELNKKYVGVEEKPKWIWHAPYVVTAKPNEQSEVKNSDHLAALLDNVDKYKVSAIVLHTGATVGLSAEEVVEGILGYFSDYYLKDLLECTKTKIAVELGASCSEFNANPAIWAAAIKDNTHMSWCLDIAHAYAAGVTWSALKSAIQIKPPAVCHINFPGSERGSGQDIHGWRSEPQIVQYDRRIETRSDRDVAKLTAEFDEVFRWLYRANVPMIVEGSSFLGCNTEQELNTLRGLSG